MGLSRGSDIFFGEELGSNKPISGGVSLIDIYLAIRRGVRGGLLREDWRGGPRRGATLFRDLWEDEGERETVLEALKADCEVRPGRPPG